MISTTSTGATAARTLNAIAPAIPNRYIRRMPYRSPRAPALSTAAAMVRVARLATNVDVVPLMFRPAEMSCRFAEKVVGSPIAMA
nr:hypothetical protein CPGR_00824 [Mycolicibacterium malmesburyense]